MYFLKLYVSVYMVEYGTVWLCMAKGRVLDRSIPLDFMLFVCVCVCVCACACACTCATMRLCDCACVSEELVLWFLLQSCLLLPVHLQGKFIRINFDVTGYIVGANIETCILIEVMDFSYCTCMFVIYSISY